VEVTIPKIGSGLQRKALRLNWQTDWRTRKWQIWGYSQYLSSKCNPSKWNLT